MNIKAFVEGPLLWFVFIFLVVGIIARFTCFVIAILKRGEHEKGLTDRAGKAALIGKVFIPMHKAMMKEPLYVIPRYIFHICVVVTPIFLTGHVNLLEMSPLELSWPTLPDAAADMMTILIIAMIAILLVRRGVLADARRRSSAFDFIFPVLCLLPFLTGYLTAHGALETDSFIGSNMLHVHIITSCVMIVMVVFLSTGTRLDVKNCMGCAACETNCPSAALQTAMEGEWKVFYYSPHECISCGSCVYACPEDAAEVRHEFRPYRFFRIRGKQEIGSVELKECRNCGSLFAPKPQIIKLGRTISKDYLLYCKDCKLTSLVDFESGSLKASAK
ncbi:MAG: 4Fe-4S dicluster domain-containing protein [Desulfobacteraceae bacterium]|nr:MAG: 4Fe-4S dicluster domain-containing protein [Desulfobacteraceae bacterium]